MKSPMCSINGCLLFRCERTQESLLKIESKLRSLITAGEDRGRDSYGIVTFSEGKEPNVFKRLGKPSSSIDEWDGHFSPSTTIVINNNRAEPTPEYISEKTERDIQPFGDNIVITHNGVVANDLELAAEYSLDPSSKIDSAVIPPLLEICWDGSVQNLKQILLEKLVGSYALGIVDSRRPTDLFLACNYKPLFIEYDRKNEVLFFSSLDDYFRNTNIFDSNPVREISPYSRVRLDTEKHLEEVSLWKSNPKRDKRALVISSGGLDSTVAAKMMIDKGYDVTLLHVRYHHRAQAKEDEAAKNIANALGVGIIFFDTDLFKKIGHSSLLDTSREISTIREGRSGAEFAHEWVPARNLIFLSIATAIAESSGYGVIATGINLEEAGAYPDNEMVFNSKFSRVLPHATQVQRRVLIEMPVGNLMKHEIVRVGLMINAPLQLTWSCYEAGEKPCGMCGPCFMRRKAFEINSVAS